MKKSGKVAFFALLIVMILIFVGVLFYTFRLYGSFSQEIPAITTEVGENTFIQADGAGIFMKEGDFASMKVNKSAYSFKLEHLEELRADFSVNDYLYFELKLYEIKKIDLNGDFVSDMIVQIDSSDGDSAKIIFQEIQEPQSVRQDVDTVLTRVNRNSQLQAYIMILIALIFLLFVAFYVMKVFVLPERKRKAELARKSDVETFNDLNEKFVMYKNQRKIDKAMKIFKKLEHLHKYMSPADKDKVKGKWDKDKLKKELMKDE